MKGTPRGARPRAPAPHPSYRNPACTAVARRGLHRPDRPHRCGHAARTDVAGAAGDLPSAPHGQSLRLPGQPSATCNPSLDSGFTLPWPSRALRGPAPGWEGQGRGSWVQGWALTTCRSTRGPARAPPWPPPALRTGRRGNPALGGLVGTRGRGSGARAREWVVRFAHRFCGMTGGLGMGVAGGSRATAEDDRPSRGDGKDGGGNMDPPSGPVPMPPPHPWRSPPISTPYSREPIHHRHLRKDTTSTAQRIPSHGRSLSTRCYVAKGMNA